MKILNLCWQPFVKNVTKTNHKNRIFLDTSVLFAGIWSEASGARMLLRLGELQTIFLVTNSQALSELNIVFERKAPQLVPRVASILDCARIEVVSAASVEFIDDVKEVVRYEPDAEILASAVESKCDYFVTLDKKHFLENKKLYHKKLIQIGTPGDCISWWRKKNFL